MMEDRKRLEVEHSDRRRSIVKGYEYQTDAALGINKEGLVKDTQAYDHYFSNMKFYSITRSSFAYRDALLFDRIKGVVALDYCCGNGEVAIEMAKQGAGRVVGIDISSVAIENARELARSAGVDAVCEFEVMDAEHTAFADETFDVIHEYGALHHLNLQAAYAELCRILKPGGRVVCTEALRHNPVIHHYRRRTSHLRTKWEFEHILGVQQVLRGLQYFEKVSTRFFHFFVLGAVPFRKTGFFDPLLRVLEAVDNIALKILHLQRLAWIAVFVLKGPRKRSF